VQTPFLLYSVGSQAAMHDLASLARIRPLIQPEHVVPSHLLQFVMNELQSVHCPSLLYSVAAQAATQVFESLERI